MPCTQPSTRSPGALFWAYTSNDDHHTASMKFIAGVDLNDISNLRTEALRIANLWKAATWSGTHILGWGIRLPDGTVYYQEAFSPVIVGTHAQNQNMINTASATVTLTGRGVPGSAGQCSGQFRFEMFVGKTYEFFIHDKELDSTTDVALTALWNGINASTYLPADFYGQQGNMRSTFPIQFNGHAQKHLGT